ncbi:hypothetical protein F2Q69_00043761 [Brassica cretica]|uniref:Uncharacterized protein n=1 Tax=Brassica cretica TaxID=69181 RepID=A0A8S9NKV1_BRACR|nr:hypothetical protein F2Q69_00043761 [Brassica cretica]
MLPRQNRSPSYLKSLSLSVSFKGWRLPNRKFKSWALKMSYLHKPAWTQAGVFEAIIASTKGFSKDTDLLLGIGEEEIEGLIEQHGGGVRLFERRAEDKVEEAAMGEGVERDREEEIERKAKPLLAAVDDCYNSMMILLQNPEILLGPEGHFWSPEAALDPEVRPLPAPVGISHSAARKLATIEFPCCMLLLQEATIRLRGFWTLLPFFPSSSLVWAVFELGEGSAFLSLGLLLRGLNDLLRPRAQIDPEVGIDPVLKSESVVREARSLGNLEKHVALASFRSEQPKIQNLEAGIWNLEPGTRNLEAGIWNLEPGTRNLEAGIWNLEAGIWNPEEVEQQCSRRLGRFPFVEQLQRNLTMVAWCAYGVPRNSSFDSPAYVTYQSCEPGRKMLCAASEPFIFLLWGGVMSLNALVASAAC